MLRLLRVADTAGVGIANKVNRATDDMISFRDLHHNVSAEFELDRPLLSVKLLQLAMTPVTDFSSIDQSRIRIVALSAYQSRIPSTSSQAPKWCALCRSVFRGYRTSFKRHALSIVVPKAGAPTPKRRLAGRWFRSNLPVCAGPNVSPRNVLKCRYPSFRHNKPKRPWGILNDACRIRKLKDVLAWRHLVTTPKMTIARGAVKS